MCLHDGRDILSLSLLRPVSMALRLAQESLLPLQEATLALQRRFQSLSCSVRPLMIRWSILLLALSAPRHGPSTMPAMLDSISSHPTSIHSKIHVGGAGKRLLEKILSMSHNTS